ncbi:Amidohydrolase family protein [Aspergillus niger]|uniref:Amidohydrolase family protein n=1 Tax=Aspergillus niger TaxID=5061 RepID=A0A505IDD3_ASPNG|nr:Amidohydrolase family protein [Aspergillus niger]
MFYENSLQRRLVRHLRLGTWSFATDSCYDHRDSDANRIKSHAKDCNDDDDSDGAIYLQLQFGLQHWSFDGFNFAAFSHGNG